MMVTTVHDTDRRTIAAPAALGAPAAPVDEQPAVVLTQAAGHDGRRRRYLTALATAVEPPTGADRTDALLLLGLMAGGAAASFLL
jgi:hypothetical protein